MSADALNNAVVRTLVPRLSRMVALTSVAITLAAPARGQEPEVTHIAYKPRGSAVTHWNAVATDAFTPSTAGFTEDEKIDILESKWWSLAELEHALTFQLMGRYLRDRNHGWGILLLAHQKPRPNGWQATVETGVLDLASVVDHLRSMARSIAASGAEAPQMAVALIDVSAVSAKSKPAARRQSSAKKGG